MNIKYIQVIMNVKNVKILKHAVKMYFCHRYRLAPCLFRMGFDRVYPVYYEISFELETENERDL
jgi:hypothetical protein